MTFIDRHIYIYIISYNIIICIYLQMQAVLCYIPKRSQDPKSPESNGAAADVGSQTGGPLVPATAARDAGAGHRRAGCWVAFGHGGSVDPWNSLKFHRMKRYGKERYIGKCRKFFKNLETCSCVVVGVPSWFFKGFPKQICLEGVMISCWHLSSIL